MAEVLPTIVHLLGSRLAIIHLLGSRVARLALCIRGTLGKGTLRMYPSFRVPTPLHWVKSTDICPCLGKYHQLYSLSIAIGNFVPIDIMCQSFKKSKLTNLFITQINGFVELIVVISRWFGTSGRICFK
jgi:hypothetical protein